MSTTPQSMTSASKDFALSQNASLFSQPRAVWAVFFACIIAFMGLGLVDPILVTITKQLHATPSQTTLLFTSYNAVMAVAMLITGMISSRLGIKWTLLTGIIVIAVFSALGGASNNIWALVGLRGGWGLGNALFVATALAAIVSLSKSGTAKAIILYEAAIGLGISVGPLLGGWLGGMSWRGPFLGVASLMVIAFFGLITLMPKTKEKNTLQSKQSIKEPFRALKHRSLLVFGIGAALYNFGFFTLLAYAPFVMGLDEHGIGFVFLGWGILLAVTSVFMAPILQKAFGTVKSMCVMLTLFAALLLAMGIWTSTQWVIIVSVLFVILNLLMTADSEFKQMIGGIPDWFQEINVETVMRIIVILIYTFGFFGLLQVLLHKQIKALKQEWNIQVVQVDAVIAITVLVMVNIVYLLFSVVQFRYLFSGTLQGDFTFAEYARKGFFELLFVTLINLSITVSVLSFVGQGSRMTKRLTQIMLTILILSSFVMLSSASIRLSLYENAYGFSFIRVLSHSFMIFLVVIFLYTLIKIWVEKLSLFHFYFISALIYYTAINMVDLNKIVVKENIARYEQSGKIDLPYFNDLSSEGTLGLIELYKKDPNVSGLRTILVERKNAAPGDYTPWQSYNLQKEQVKQQLRELVLGTK